MPARTGGSTLVLDVKVESDGGPGGHVVTWKAAEYRETISGGRYHEVTIGGETDEHAIKVERVPS